MSVQSIGKRTGVYLVRLVTALILLLTALSWIGVLLSPSPQSLSHALLLTCVSLAILLTAYGIGRIR
jgi:hypothetical protein